MMKPGTWIVCALIAVAGCSSGGGSYYHGGGGGPTSDDGGALATDGGTHGDMKSSRCGADSDCRAPTPRCDVASGKCVACLPTNDNCPNGTHCLQTNGTYTCTAGCQMAGDCTQGFSVPACCSGMCFDLSSDVHHCGGCGIDCGSPPNATGECVGQSCGIGACDAGWSDCDRLVSNGCEVNTDSDPRNCGGCGAACSFAHATGTCTGGQCTITQCNFGYGDCDGLGSTGCETSILSDPQNCGACGHTCPVNTPSCVNGQCTGQAQSGRVLIVGAPAMTTWNNDVQSKLLATGAFKAVDIFNAASGTPTLAQLQPYDAVLVYSDTTFSDATTLGNNLADYYDGGGRVVVAVFADCAAPIAGRFGTEANGYVLIHAAAQSSPNDSLGQVNEPLSPLMSGVRSLAASSAFQSTGAAVNGGIVVARWTGGNPLVVRGVVKGRNRADLNFFPPSSTSRNDFWTGDGATLMKNALLYR